MTRSTHLSSSDGTYYERSTDDRGVEIREHRRWISPGRVIGGLLGVALVIFGAVVTVRAGLDSSLNVPLVSVVGVTASAIIGLATLVSGLLVLLASVDEAERPFVTFLGALGVLAGILGLAITGDLRTTIGYDNSTAWFFIIWGAVAVVAGMIPSVLRSRRDVREPRLTV